MISNQVIKYELDKNDHLQSDAFPRVRIGVGKVSGAELANHVLGTFSKEDGVRVTRCIKETDKITEEIISRGVSAAMNKFNGTDFGEQ